MVIGINLNGVLRDFFGKIEDVHRKYFPEHEEINVQDYNLEKWVTFPIEEVKQNEIEFDPDFNSLDIITDEVEDIPLEVKTHQTTLEEFLYEKCTLEIFGYANELGNNFVQHVNNIITNTPEHEFYIISNEKGLSIPSTLFLLSKTKFQGSNIKFIDNESDCWNFVDMMITDNPEVLQSKPDTCISVKIKKDYNATIDSNYTLDTIKELDGDLINEWFKKLWGQNV